MDVEKRIAEIYCANPAAVQSLFINGKLYSKDDLLAIAKKYLNESGCNCVDLLSKDNLNDRLDRNIHNKMMSSFRSNIKIFKDHL